MADYLSVLESLGGGSEGGVKAINGAKNGEDSTADSKDDTEEEIDEKELEEQVSDLVEIRSKEMLKRNVRNIVKENLLLKAKVKRLEAKLQETSQQSDQSMNMLFRIDLGDDFDEDQEVPIGEAERILTNSQEEEKVEETKAASGNKCFNCLGDHMINDCPQPRDQKAIAMNRREFMSKNVSYSRYHVDERFGHLRAGLPSEKLRSALGLKEDQVPEYIYRMRSLGYPPGWLKAAQVGSSGIVMYHSKGKTVGGLGEEDGEVVDEQDKIKYNMEKLIDWPGFNSRLPKEYKDESKKYGALSYSAVKTLKQMIEELKPKEQKGYVRRKMVNNTTKFESDEEGEVIDLDSSQDDSVIIIEEEQHNSKKIKKYDSVVILEKDVETAIEGLEDGELELTSSKSATSTPLRESSNPMATPSRQSSQASSTSSSIAKTEPGTPIVEIYSPFTRLPSQNSFGKDMSEHIVFENLPDYTGKWDQMRGLLGRIRKRKEIGEDGGDEDND